jgi:hypothetical protein
MERKSCGRSVKTRWKCAGGQVGLRPASGQGPRRSWLMLLHPLPGLFVIRVKAQYLHVGSGSLVDSSGRP